MTEGNDKVGILHSRSDKVIVGGLDEAIVLGQNIDNSSTSISNISLNYASKTRLNSLMKLTSTSKADIVRCQHKDLQVHQLAETIFYDGMNALKDDDWRTLDCFGHGGSFMECKVIGGDHSILSIDQLLQLLVSEVEVKSGWMIEVVVRSVLVLLVPINETNIVIRHGSWHLREALIEHVEGK